MSSLSGSSPAAVLTAASPAMIAEGPSRKPVSRPVERTRRMALIRQRWRDDGGAERQVRSVLECLRGQWDVTLITRAWDGQDEHNVLRCDPPRLGRMWREWGFARAVRSVLRQHAFDLVQSHERIAGCDIYRAGDGVHREWLQQRGRTQSSLGRWISALSPYHLYVKSAERRLFEDARLRAVICNSQMVRQEITRWFRVRADKLRVIYSGVDTVRFHPGLRRHRQEVRHRLSVPEDAALFVFVGSGFDRKGLTAAIDALARTAGTYLVAVGRDKRPARFQRQARRLGIGDRLRLVGRQADVAPFYGAADALVLPTLYEPFSNVALEAMASGLPVVTSTKNGAAEIITDGENGFVCDALDRDGIRQALCQLADRSRRDRMGRCARAAAEPLNCQSMRNQLVKLYTELFDGHD